MKQSGALAQALRDAARVVAAVAEGRSLVDELAQTAVEAMETPRAALLDLTHGCLRRYGRVQAIVRALSRRARQDPKVEALLWVALYACESGRYADYTVVDQAVRACGLLERWSAKSYVNAVLRGYLRDRAAVEARLEASEEARYQHPLWWIERVRRAYPGAWQAVLEAGNSHPPMTLRVNRRRLRAQDYVERLSSSGIESRMLGAEAVLLERPLPVERLPGFLEGAVSVQDAGAQRVAPCLDLAPGQRVLDACAAPGGKSAQILEHADVELTALDLDAKRAERIKLNLERLGLRADVRSADCTRPDSWWDQRPFDRILADVPCTASGVVRRHPDLKWLRRASDVAAAAARQAHILDALWRVLAPDGKLLYVTCSVFPEENAALVDDFLARSPQAVRLPLPDGAGAQWLPGPEHDGFFYALIQKQA